MTDIHVWKCTYYPTTEYLRLRSADGYSIKSYITGEAGGFPLFATYRLSIDEHWQTRSVQVYVQGKHTFRIGLIRREKNQWFNAAGLVEDLSGCIDIDLSLSPFTNTLPINRLQLQPGQSAEIKVVYFNLLEAVCEPARQRYTRLNAHEYLYEGLGTGFTSTIEVDDKGIVLNYPGIWERIFPPAL